MLSRLTNWPIRILHLDLPFPLHRRLRLIPAALHPVESRLGLRFRDKALLHRAFIHRSFLNELLDDKRSWSTTNAWSFWATRCSATW